MHIHFIAIGGSAMHNLAIALHRKGYSVSGSDDEIFEPSQSRLKNLGLLPDEMGWFPERIHKKLDAVILGMHAHADNPELARAKELGLRIYSYPEYMYEQTKEKERIVIGGSHGKTSTTAMILHVLNELERPADYMVGAQLDGYDCMVGLSEGEGIAVLEGDEYLSSTLDPRPKFHLYKPHIALLTGVAWDHINVFPTFENYVLQFSLFAQQIETGGSLIYFSGDPELEKIAETLRPDIKAIPYHTHPYTIKEGITYLETPYGEIGLKIFGEHNLQNLQGAKLVCNEIGISDYAFYKAIQNFGGAAKRLEKLAESKERVIYRDFAHSPSKLKATTHALKQQFPHRKLVACMELHTYSSLNASFLQEYAQSMKDADLALVCYSPKTVRLKRLENIDPEDIQKYFAHTNLEVFTDTESLERRLYALSWKNSNLLLMSSGHFGGIEMGPLSKHVLESEL